MREIKLQVISTSTITPKIIGYEWIASNGRWMHQYEGQPVSEGIASGNYTRRQFTGLLDKNGKEIYEGDICYKKGYGRKCVIRFNEEWLKYEAFYGIGDNGSDLTMGLGHWNKRHCDICNEQEQITEAIFGNTLEVIGNIYENPELLTK